MTSCVTAFVLVILFIWIQDAHLKAQQPPQKTPPTKSSCETSCNDKSLDISLVVDSSRSVSKQNFQKGLSFLANLTASFDISTRRARFSLITYGRGTYDDTAFDFDAYTDQVSLKNAINNTPHTAGDHTDTGQGIKFMRERQMLPKQRPEAAHIAIVLTDGNSQDWMDTYSEADKARKAGIQMYAIGVGKIRVEELRKIADNENHVFYADRYQDLETIRSKLHRRICADD